MFAGASFVAAYLAGVFAELHERGKRRAPVPALRPVHGLVLLAVSGALAFVVLSGGPEYKSWIRNSWGRTHSWVVAVFWIGSALFLLCAWLERPRRIFRLAAAGFAWTVGLGESWRATWTVFRHDEMEGVWPTTIRRDLDLMHDPLELEGRLFLVGLAVLMAWGHVATRHVRPARPWLLAAAVLAGGSLLVNVQMGDWGNDVGAPLMRIVGGACLLYGSLLVLLESRATSAVPHTAPRERATP